MRAKKSLGQNFLLHPHIVERILSFVPLTSSDTVVEIGPGKGILTRALAKRAGKVIAIEKDFALADALKKEFATQPNVHIIEGDALEFSPEKEGLREGEYLIVANIPYNITSHLIRLILEEWPRPTSATLLVQKEVARKIIAQPPQMNLLALSVAVFANAKYLMPVSRRNFLPVPNVDSAVVSLTPRPHTYSKKYLTKFFAIARAAFQGKRKQIRNTLKQFGISTIDISLTARPQELTVEEWHRLVSRLPDEYNEETV